MSTATCRLIRQSTALPLLWRVTRPLPTTCGNLIRRRLALAISIYDFVAVEPTPPTSSSQSPQMRRILGRNSSARHPVAFRRIATGACDYVTPPVCPGRGMRTTNLVRPCPPRTNPRWHRDGGGGWGGCVETHQEDAEGLIRHADKGVYAWPAARPPLEVRRRLRI